MKTPPNAFKQALANRQRQIGLWMGLATPYAAELCAGSGFDWIVIDGEHAPNDLRSTLAALQAVAPYPSHPVVRLPQGDAVLIKQVLEIGATTLLVPMVESADMAAALVSAMRYPPQGTRGVGSGLARSSRWNRYDDYLHAANDTACLLVQVETAEALAQVDAIASVDGVDGVFIGPADLAASMGYLGQATHPDVRKAIEDGIARIRAAGKPAGILCVDETLARHYLDLGVTFIAVGIDTSLLANASRALAAKFADSAD
ncbi:4-hydroxy-2-oxoheptanedioate aldolase [Pandoraea norimbergensis]|uniref:5-keto-4-deoxy-D-glucarate aldolase n=1 Tax=Pandoraea norimbergensis TaxID=93219 RepID=A0ABN4JG46_9BURK|nr:4-hydroxy-2-oxoheptanedioate aldolase [Pandoraea norimbergensis]ALS59479.1 2,4-dihydroxyhept-2-ene-1,7-dioic acid aldolase [Pandoraea norimbergensis]